MKVLCCLKLAVAAGCHILVSIWVVNPAILLGINHLLSSALNIYAHIYARNNQVKHRDGISSPVQSHRSHLF